MIYRFLKRIVTIALFVFFKKIVVTGKNNIPKKGPLIIVANHPNTFMDPIIITSITKQRLGFVANAGIFANKVLAKIFNYLHIIPIYRKKDIKPGENPDNRKTFVKCHEYLEKKRTFLIFPEGSSYYELKLREIKTGTARIALSFEDLHNFESGLEILPIALDYSDSLQFRSIVSTTVSPPISTAKYKEAFKENEFGAVKQLTEDIRKSLAKNVIQTSGKRQEQFLLRAHKFYSTFYEPNADSYHNPKRSLELRHQLSKALHIIEEKDQDLYHDIETKTHDFFNGLHKEGLTPGFFSDSFIKKNKILVYFGYFFQFFLLLPAYIFGLIANYLPYIIPGRIFKALKIDIEYMSPVQMVTGLITFPLFYFLEIYLFRVFISKELWMTVTLLFILPISGYITMYYWTELQRFMRIVHFYFFMRTDKKMELLHLRDNLLAQIEKARNKIN